MIGTEPGGIGSARGRSKPAPLRLDAAHSVLILPLKEKDRPIQSAGQFLMRGTAISVALKEHDQISFGLSEPYPDDIRLFVTILRIPDGCAFGD